MLYGVYIDVPASLLHTNSGRVLLVLLFSLLCILFFPVFHCNIPPVVLSASAGRWLLSLANKPQAVVYVTAGEVGAQLLILPCRLVDE